MAAKRLSRARGSLVAAALCAACVLLAAETQETLITFKAGALPPSFNPYPDAVAARSNIISVRRHASFTGRSYIRTLSGWDGPPPCSRWDGVDCHTRNDRLRRQRRQNDRSRARDGRLVQLSIVVGGLICRSAAVANFFFRITRKDDLSRYFPAYTLSDARARNMVLAIRRLSGQSRN
jgi:hypothetical protein